MDYNAVDEKRNRELLAMTAKGWESPRLEKELNEVPRMRSIRDCCDSLHEEIAELPAVLKELEARLEPVLRADLNYEDQQSGKPDVSPKPVVSPVQVRLLDEEQAVRRVKRLLFALMDRLDI